MSTQRQRALPLYAFGLACLFVGAWASEMSGTMVPLAMGASAALMCTVRVVQRIRAKHTRRLDS